MFRSLQWRLQGWYALILLLVVTSFGAVFFTAARKARFDEIDAELLSAARVLEGVLRTVPQQRRLLPPGPPPDDRPPGEASPPPFARPNEFEPRNAQPPGGPDGPPPRRLPPRPNDPPGRRPLLDRQTRILAPDIFSLPNSFRDRYQEDGDEPYFVVRTSAGELIRANPRDAATSVPIDHTVGRWYESHSRNRGDLREVSLLGPSDTNILVGRSIRHELDGLHRLAWQLALTGLGVFSAGLLGGWWLSSRAVRPVVVMSQTISEINASNLSRRLNLAGVDTELSQLGLLVNQMLDRLENSFDQQARFTADASHELRTPLAIILSQVELALARTREPQAYRDALEACGRAAGRMKSLVENLLTLARADSDKLELRKDPVDLAKIASENILMLEPLAKERDVNVRIDAGPARVVGDAGRLSQVIMNLLSNAIQYNKPGGQVLITTATDQDQAILTVSDTGAGIPEADLPRLFSRFHRVDSARSRTTGGSGLGLAICRSIVEGHGGTISVTSSLDQGTEFVVRLPLATSA